MNLFKYSILLSFLMVFTQVQILKAQLSLSSTNLPIIVINTPNGAAIPNEPKLTADMGIIWKGDNGTQSFSDPSNHYNGKIGIELRGSSSQTFPKKGYGFETRKADGNSLDISLLGFPAENDWVLHGPYSDKSLMRNAIAYILAGWIMEYAPRVKFVEVMLNGSYQGVYLFTEKLKRDANRVKIANLDPDENSGDDLTGGYILKIDKWTGAFNDGFDSQYKPYPGTKAVTTFLYHFPEPEDISTQQKTYIKNYMNQAEASLQAPNFTHPVDGYRKYFDVPSFIQNMIIQEITKNVDAYRLSQFMYKDKESVNNKLKMGPVWDFDLGIGNANYCAGELTTGWAFNFNQVCPGDGWQVHFWWSRMMEDPAFRNELGSTWKMLRQTKFTNVKIIGLVDSLKKVIKEPSFRNFDKWRILDKWVWPNVYVGYTWENEASYLQNWLIARMEWLDTNFGKMTPVAENESRAKEATVYPNPFNQTFTLEFTMDNSHPYQIIVLNGVGQKVSMQHSEGIGGMKKHEIKLDGASGLYFYNIVSDGEIKYAGKLIKN
jgi:hypothetical protein